MIPVHFAKLNKVSFSFLYCMWSYFSKFLHLLHSIKINNKFINPIFTGKGINNGRFHVTANTSAAKLDFGWNSKALIRGKGYTASPPFWERMRGISSASIAVSNVKSISQQCLVKWIKEWSKMIAGIILLSIFLYSQAFYTRETNCQKPTENLE